MVLRAMFRKLFCKQVSFAIVLGSFNVFVLPAIYYDILAKRMIQNQPHLGGRSQIEKRNNTVYHDSKFTIHNSKYGPRCDVKSEGDTAAASSEFLSEDNHKVLNLTMKGCPNDWPLEVLRNDSAGMPAAQVCRSKTVNGRWKCAKGWKTVRSDPYCIKITTPPPIADLIVSIGEENYEGQTLRQLVSDNFKLLFYQLPGTVVDISPSVFRVLRKTETFDQALLDHYHKFTLVMHPCLRLIKIWESASKQTINQAVNTSFTSFLNDRLPSWKPGLLLNEQNSLKPQSDLLFDNRHRPVSLDQILMLERWNKSLFELMKRANINTNSFLFIRANSSNKECSRMYTPETWLKMTNYYAMDFCVLQYSINVNETHVLPPLEFTTQEVTSRYRTCRHKASDRHTLIRVNSSRAAITSPNPCTIHTYFQPAFDGPKERLANQNVLSIWEAIWASAGWQTRVLNESNAMLHPYYEYLKEKFMSFPTVNVKNYTVGNFIRHLAMATVGGGWMSDYDTLPLHFPPCSKLPFNGSFTVWSGFIPALVSGHGDEYMRVAHLMGDVGLHWRARPELFIESNGRAQVSDMKTLLVLADVGYIKSFRVIIETSDYSDGGFSCNKAKSSGSKTFPEGIPTLPWGVHLSHAYMSYMRRRNIAVWPGLSWKEERATRSSTFRATFIKYMYNIYLEKCQL